MRLNIAIFFGALFGALGVLLFLVAFGSDYWLLATEVGKCSGEQNIENVTFHHEGFFWRCWFNGIVGENDSNIWQFWYSVLFSLVMMLYVIWVQAVADMESYRHVKMRYCLDFNPSVLYGWSFFLAPAGIFFSLLAGLLFLLVGRHIQIHH
ncbi:hypothetical protein FD755_008726 [Muntiacus reevesi]|uniref:Transmembrane protein 182 n=1 Tax=Muntiacus reevesi TaxID=9886 RepID=A0A5J5MMY2_MUNRE|nr:hypothetical protein FD755_008726 [Muntiacus reevesi]